METPPAKYFKTTNERIIDALRVGFGARFKRYYDGDPIAIPQASLPCIVVEKESSRISQENTGMDSEVATIVIKVLINKKLDFSNRTMPQTSQQTTHTDLQRLIQGRDPSTKHYIAESVMGIVRTGFTFENTVVNQTVSIEYGVGFRPGDVTTSEGRLRIEVEELTTVPSRT